MALKGYLIEKYNNMADAYTCYRLIEEAEKAGIDLKITGVEDTVFSDGYLFNDGIRLEECDFIINRYKYGKIKDEINNLARKTYNDISLFNIYIDKYEQLLRIKSEVFKVPEYILADADYEYEKIKESFGTPFIAKGLESSMGREIFLIKNKEDYKKLTEDYEKDKKWLFEEFIASSYGKDLRFFLLRGEVIACMKRESAADFRANVALGASVEKYEINEEIKKIGRDIYECTGLDYLGVDLLFGEYSLYFCEINVMPGLKGIEESSGKNIAGEIIKMIKGDFDE